jgi:hypothetical protein
VPVSVTGSHPTVQPASRAARTHHPPPGPRPAARHGGPPQRGSRPQPATARTGPFHAAATIPPDEEVSVDDSFAYAVWNDDELVRSLSVSLPRRIIEDIGQPLEFERPFRAARQAFIDRHPGALGFHPLDVAQQAMRFLFGFALEGTPQPDDIDAGQISMLGYRVTDPTGAEQAARETARREFLRHHRRQSYRIGPDGSLVEIDEERGLG